MKGVALIQMYFRNVGSKETDKENPQYKRCVLHILLTADYNISLTAESKHLRFSIVRQFVLRVPGMI